jgi:hypothetical protein
MFYRFALDNLLASGPAARPAQILLSMHVLPPGTALRHRPLKDGLITKVQELRSLWPKPLDRGKAAGRSA